MQKGSVSKLKEVTWWREAPWAGFWLAARRLSQSVSLFDVLDGHRSSDSGPYHLWLPAQVLFLHTHGDT